MFKIASLVSFGVTAGISVFLFTKAIVLFGYDSFVGGLFCLLFAWIFLSAVYSFIVALFMKESSWFNYFHFFAFSIFILLSLTVYLLPITGPWLLFMLAALFFDVGFMIACTIFLFVQQLVQTRLRLPI